MNVETNGMANDDAQLDNLEDDIRTLLADARSGGQTKEIIAQVVVDSDFIPRDQEAKVAVEMVERLEDSEAGQ